MVLRLRARNSLRYLGVMVAKDRPVESANDLSDEETMVLLRVAEVLRRIEFGTILVVVQDGRVIQIEMAEKVPS